MIYHAASVVRGVGRALVLGTMIHEAVGHFVADVKAKDFTSDKGGVLRPCRAKPLLGRALTHQRLGATAGNAYAAWVVR